VRYRTVLGDQFLAHELERAFAVPAGTLVVRVRGERQERVGRERVPVRERRLVDRRRRPSLALARLQHVVRRVARGRLTPRERLTRPERRRQVVHARVRPGQVAVVARVQVRVRERADERSVRVQ